MTGKKHIIAGAGPAGLMTALAFADELAKKGINPSDRIEIMSDDGRAVNTGNFYLTENCYNKIKTYAPEIAEVLIKSFNNTIETADTKAAKAAVVSIQFLTEHLEQCLRDRYDIDVKHGFKLKDVEKSEEENVAIFTNDEGQEEKREYASLTVACGKHASKKFANTNINPQFEEVTSGLGLSATVKFNYLPGHVEGSKAISRIAAFGPIYSKDARIGIMKEGDKLYLLGEIPPKEYNIYDEKTVEGKAEYACDVIKILNEAFPEVFKEWGVDVDAITKEGLVQQFDRENPELYSSVYTVGTGLAKNIANTDYNIMLAGDAATTSHVAYGSGLNSFIEGRLDIHIKALKDMEDPKNSTIENQKKIIADFGKEVNEFIKDPAKNFAFYAYTDVTGFNKQKYSISDWFSKQSWKQWTTESLNYFRVSSMILPRLMDSKNKIISPVANKYYAEKAINYMYPGNDNNGDNAIFNCLTDLISQEGNQDISKQDISKRLASSNLTQQDDLRTKLNNIFANKDMTQESYKKAAASAIYATIPKKRETIAQYVACDTSNNTPSTKVALGALNAAKVRLRSNTTRAINYIGNYLQSNNQQVSGGRT